MLLSAGHCLNRHSCLVFIVADQMQFHRMNSFSYTLKTKRLFPLVATTVSFTKHNGNHSENTATFCNISGFFLYSMRCDINWPETTMFWSKNSKCQLTLLLEHLTLQIQISSYYRVRHPNNYSKMIAARAARDLLSETGAEKKKRISPPISRWPLSSVYNFFLFLLVLCLQHERTFSSAYISQVFSACPKHYTWRQIFNFSSSL